jgi:hypothetical protein
MIDVKRRNKGKLLCLFFVFVFDNGYVLMVIELL